MFDSISPEYSAHFGDDLMSESDFDWELHPGGEAIINGVQQIMDLTEHQFRASRENNITLGEIAPLRRY